jgi:hypothetical protein
LPKDDAKLPGIAPVSSPLFTDLYEHTALLEAGDLNPASNQGWTYDAQKRWWKTDRPGSVLEFELPGRLIYAMHYRIHGPMGRASVKVDDLPVVVLEGWFDQTWGGYRHTTLVAPDLPPGPHRVRIQLLPERDEHSAGNESRLMGLGAAGTD